MLAHKSLFYKILVKDYKILVIKLLLFEQKLNIDIFLLNKMPTKIIKIFNKAYRNQEKK